MLIIERENSAFLKLISSEESVIKHISDQYTFEVPNYRFTTAYKNGRRWDGKIRLLKKKQFLYSGLLANLETFLKKNNYPYENKFYEEIIKFDIKEIKEFISSLNINLEIRDYQINSVFNLINNKNSLLISPTASGKGMVIFLCLVFLIKHNLAKRILITVPTVSLVNQLYQDFLSYCSYPKIKSFFENNVHCLYSGQEKFSNKPITISTYQSIINLPKEFLEHQDAVFSDEVHLMSKSSGQFIFENAINTNYRFGFTGTLQECLLDTLVLEGLIGQPFQLVTTSQLIEKGQIADLKIHNVILNYSKPLAKIISNLNFQEEYQLIISNPTRMEILTDFISNLDKNTLVLFTRIESHGDVITEELRKKNPNKQIIYLTGKNKADEREASRITTERDNNVIIVASYGIFSTGISINNLHNVIFASPYKAIDINEKVLTINGFKKHGDLNVGDKIFGPDGKERNVLAKTPIFYNADCFKITFESGYSLSVSGDHLWKLKNDEIKSTKELFENFEKNRLKKRWLKYQISISEPIEFEEKELPIEPYYLGLWLGDGNCRNIGITCDNKDIDDIIVALKENNHTVKILNYQFGSSVIYCDMPPYDKDGNQLYCLRGHNKINKLGCKECRQQRKLNKKFGTEMEPIIYQPLQIKLRENNLLQNKHIPEIYFNSSKEQRIKLLQGLLDSDGHCSFNDNRITFSNTNLELINGVFRLVCSLGFKPTIKKYIHKNTLYKEYYHVSFRSDTKFPLFKIKRKLERCSPIKDNIFHKIINIESITPIPCSCIEVDSDGMYLIGEHLIPTHNSKIKVLQSIGRGLRLHSNKNHCSIYDFVDFAKYKDKSNYFLEHFFSRYELYQKENFNTDFIKIPREII